MTHLEKDILLPFKGYIFDIDGTMIHSMKLHVKAWQKTLEKYGKPMSLKEVGEVTYGINPEIVRRVFRNKISEEEVEQIANDKEKLFRDSFDPEEDVVKGFIRFIHATKEKGIPMVIGSAAPPQNIDFFMERLGIGHFFEGRVHEDDVRKGKPSPEVFLKAAAIINVPANDCVVFEDSPTGAEASASAGCKTIVLTTSKSKSDFKEITDIVAYVDDYTELTLIQVGSS